MRSSQRLIKVSEPWFEEAVASQEEFAGCRCPVSESELRSARLECAALYEEQLKLWESYKRKAMRGENRLNSRMKRFGTLQDKLVALTLEIRESAFFSLPEIRQMVASAQKKGRREVESSSKYFVDLCCENLMPKDRLLLSLVHRPILPIAKAAEHNKTTLLLWYFEDQLKECYQQFCRAMQVGTRDSIDFQRDHCIKMVHRLLVEVPEYEKENLALLVSKAGDLKKKIASRASYLLGLLLEKHPNMRNAVVEEVERFLYRPSCTSKARYYLSVFLSQIALQKDDHKLAGVLVKMYLAMVDRLLDGELDADEKIALEKRQLKGKTLSKKQKKKAAALAKSKGKDKKSKRKMLHNKAKPAKLDSKLTSTVLAGLSRAIPYLSKEDAAMLPEKTTRIFEIVYKGEFKKAVQALAILLRIMVAHKSISDKFYEALYFMILHPDFRSSRRQGLFLNIVYGGIRHDTSIPRVRAFIKRLLQVAIFDNHPSLSAAIMVVVSEAFRLHPEAQQMLTVAEEHPDETVAEEEAKEEEEEEEEEEEAMPGFVSAKELVEERSKQLKFLGSIVQEEQEEEPKKKKQEQETPFKKSSGSYNPLTHNPARARADKSCLWELLLLRDHFHPSVKVFAERLLAGEFLDYQGDPLLDFSLASFVDRLAYRQPKTKAGHQPAAHEAVFRNVRLSHAETAAPVTSKEFLEQDPSTVRPEERFMYDHLKKMREQKRKELEKMGVVQGLSDEEFDEDMLIDELEMGNDYDDDDVEGLGSIEDEDEFDEDDLADLDDEEEDLGDEQDEEDEINERFWGDNALVDVFQDNDDDDDDDGKGKKKKKRDHDDDDDDDDNDGIDDGGRSKFSKKKKTSSKQRK